MKQYKVELTVEVFEDTDTAEFVNDCLSEHLQFASAEYDFNEEPDFKKITINSVTPL